LNDYDLCRDMIGSFGRKIAMAEIEDWLETLGMPQYAERFAENAIDASVLKYLTDQDLKDIGVLLGHRRKMLATIARSSDATLASLQSFAQRKRHDAAERRQLTVMICDLVGSTELSARHDPEDLRAIIGAYHDCCTELVEGHDGFVAKYMGDGMVAYFGYPQAQENDPERAVRAGLGLVAAVPKLASPFGSPLQVRVGIATGLVVVGDLIGSGQAQERSILGETPNLAARLQAIAAPNSVVIADSTRKLLGNLFEFVDLGSWDLKGIAAPARAWVALRASALASRFEALRTTDLTALIGRDEESKLLLARWSKAKAGDGQVVLISGEAGIGKSRLTTALSERLVTERHARLRFFCSPQHENSALYPIIGQMERAAGLAHDDSPRAKLDKLDAMLAQNPTSTLDAALFAEMLSLGNDGRYPAPALTPHQRRQRTLDALVSQIHALAHRGPALIIFEDVQWIDPTSRELLGLVVDRIETLRVLLLVTFRPEVAPPWVGRHHVTTLTINPLAQHEVGAMIDRIAGNNPLPSDLTAEITERTDGIPLFVEEMTKAVLEAESEREARQTAAAIAPSGLAVPASLHSPLMARLDRLGPAKEVAQVGAAIGREFPHALLAAVVPRPETLGAALDRLIAAGLLFRRGVPPHATYLFKHVLVRDAAYSTLLREPRRALHAKIADALESRFADVVGSRPEILARHYYEAGLMEKAAALWGEAGQRSLAQSALIEAMEQLTRALDQIAALPATPALRRQQIKFQVALITPLIHVKGFAAPQAKAAVERARMLIDQAEDLGEPPQDPLLLYSVLYGVWVANLVAFDGNVVRELAAQFLALAEKQKAAVPLMIGHRLMGIALYCTGDIAHGRAHFDRALARYDPVQHLPLASRFSVDTKVSVLSYRSMALWTLGYPEAALADTDDALKDARETGQAATLMYALTSANFVHVCCGNGAAATAEADELAALASEKGALLWKSHSIMAQGLALALTGKPSEAVPTINSGIAGWRSTGATLWIPLYTSNLAKAYAEVGRPDDAWRCIDDAITSVDTSKESWCEADVHRIAGEIALLAPQPDAAKAETHFARALTVARGQMAKSWELRAAMSMARLWRDQGKRQQAHDLLAPVYGWFTEGFATRDLQHAKTLLDELGTGVIPPP
jgi:class 3 adenylate cyclase/predicted ATPase